MSQANVKSLDAMRRFRAHLQEFQETGVDALSAMQQQIVGFLDWLEHDRPNFWKQYMLRSFDVIAEARAALQKCEMRTVAGHKPTCYEEKLALKAAKQRLEMAQQKVEAVKHWSVNVHHEIDEHGGRRGSLMRYLEEDVEKSMATLARMIAAIEAYAEIESAAADSPPP